MAITANPRSVSDATRFTPTTPHATSKSTAPGSGSSTGGPSRFAPSSDRSPLQPPSGPPRCETPEQRVARLRAAHEAAHRAQISRFDRVAAVGRSFFDRAHSVTVAGLVGLTGTTPCLSLLGGVSLDTRRE